MEYKLKIRKKERRRTQRLNIPLKLAYKWPSRIGTLQQVFAQDISGGGMKIRVDTPFQKGDRLKAKLYFPDQPKPINVASEVIWCKRRKVRGRLRFDVGIKHVHIVPRDRERFVFLFCEAMLNYVMFSSR